MSDSFKDYALPISIFLAALLIGGVILYTNKGGAERNGGVVDNQPSGDNQPSPSPDAGSGEVPEVTDEDHIRGNPEASVTIIEYSDFECPYCGSFHPSLVKAMEEYGDQIRLVYRHFPLSFHPQAMPAAIASECVAEQAGDDGFWQFTDTMFENQSRLGRDYYVETAQSIGVDVSQFEDCIDSEKYKEEVQQEMSEGQSAGVTGTPGSFVNGEELRGAVPYNQLKSAIEQALGE